MKPTKMRNQMIYRASHVIRSKQIASPLSKELQKKYTKKSVRVIEGDSIKIVRGEFKGVDGKIANISVQKSSLAIEGVKKEKTKGDKFDVYVHSSNVVVTGLNSDDKWRISRLEGKKHPTKKGDTKVEKPKVKETVEKELSNNETKVEKPKVKETVEKELSNKETKVEKPKVKEDEK